VNENQLMISLRHEGMLSFHINIVLEKEQDRIDVMEQLLYRLVNENIYLKQQTESILKVIQENSNWDTESEYLWLKLDKMCINNNINDTIVPFSGESVDEIGMKKRIISNNYWSCYVSEDGKCYYSGVTMHWKHCISGLTPARPPNTDRPVANSTLYIRIPKQDIRDGIGETHEYNGKMYHGGRIERLPGEPSYALRDGHRFIIQYGSDKYKEPDHPRVPIADIEYPFNNIHIPPDLYCKNCIRKISADGWDAPEEQLIRTGGWQSYECQGH